MKQSKQAEDANAGGDMWDEDDGGCSERMDDEGRRWGYILTRQGAAEANVGADREARHRRKGGEQN